MKTDILSPVDRSLQDQRAELSPEAQRELKGTHKPKVRTLLDVLLDSAPNPSQEQETVFGVVSGFSLLVKPEDRIRITELDAKSKEISENIAKHCGRSAKDEFQEQQKEAEELLRQGADPADFRVQSKEQIEEYHSLKKKLLKRQKREVALQAIAIVMPYLALYADMVDAYADTLDAEDKKLAEKLKMEFRPSNVSLVVRKAARNARFRSQEAQINLGPSPKDVAHILFY